jgi:hypothetical protein
MKILEEFNSVECLKCNQPVRVFLLGMEAGGLLWKAECTSCHVRTWKRIEPAGQRELSAVEVCDRANRTASKAMTLSGRLKCPTCDDYCSKITLHRGALMCDQCVKLCGG